MVIQGMGPSQNKCKDKMRDNIYIENTSAMENNLTDSFILADICPHLFPDPAGNVHSTNTDCHLLPGTL